MSVTAIVPLKALDHSKQRLAGRLSATERRALMRALFQHVLETCVAADGIDAVLAIVGDDTGLDLARRLSVPAVRELGEDLNSAVRQATAQLSPESTSLVVVADLPALTTDDVEAIIAAGQHTPGVLVAPTHDGGTGALLRRPAAVIAPAFGAGSAAAHLDAAREAGVRAGVIMRPGLAYDVDRPVDLDRYAGLVVGGGEP